MRALSNRLLLTLLLIALLVTGILAGTPLLIRHYAVNWLQENGGDRVRFEDVDLNPFTATLALKELQVVVNEQTTLSFKTATAELAWLPLWHKQIVIRAVTLNGLDLIVHQLPERILIGGIHLPESSAKTPAEPPPERPWTAGIDSLELTDIKVRYIDDKLDLVLGLDQLQLDNLAQWSKNTPTPLEASGTLNDAPFALSGEIAPLADIPRYNITLKLDALQLAAFDKLLQEQLGRLSGKLSYDGALEYAQRPDGFDVSQAGSVQLQAFDVAVKQPAIGVQGKETKVDSELTLASGEDDLQLKLKSDIGLEDMEVSAEEGRLQLRRYDGTVEYAQRPGGFDVSQTGSLQLQAFDVAVKQPAVAITGKETDIDSELVLAGGDGDLQLQLKSDINLAGLDVTAYEARLGLLRSEGLKLSKLNMTAVDQVSLQSLLADKLAFARRTGTAEQASSVDVDRLEVTSVSLADNLLSIDKVHASGAQRELLRDSEGKLAITTIIDDIKRLTATEGPAEEGPADDAAADTAAPDSDDTAGTDAEKPPMAVAIGSILIDGDSAYSLRDESVKPPVQAKLGIKTLSLESLDSRKPEQNSPVKIDATLGERTELTLQGDIRPFTDPPGMAIKSRISSLDLPPLSPYAEQSMGLELDSGTLDADINITSGGKKMDGLVKLKLYQLQLKTVESENSLQSQLPVPVNVALDTLRDSNNTIALKVPIKGDPANPDFNINDALTKALASGVQKGALTYLTLALQPYGAMITAAKYAGEAINKVRLNPVAFAPGQSSLDATATDYLSKVGKMLKDRPQLAVKVCGVAVEQDRSWLQEQASATQQQKTDKKDKNGKPQESPAAPAISDATLRDLAKARADSVRNHLVNRFQTPGSHLVSCQPRFESGDKDGGGPRTDLLL